MNTEEPLLTILRKTVCRTHRAHQARSPRGYRADSSAVLPCEAGENCVRETWCLNEAQQVLDYARDTIERPAIFTR